MPEDTVNYKVNIDASDVATQLEQIRAQVDASMGAMSMASASMPVGFNSPVSASAPMMELNPYNTINALSSSFANQAFSTGISESQGLGAFIQGTSEAFNLGYGKFSNGVRQMGLMAEMPPLISHPTGGLDTFTLNMEAIQHAPMFTASGQRGHPGSIAGSLGIGFDKMGPLTYQESVDASRQNLASQIGKLSSAWVGTAVGAAAGSIVPGGTIGGMAVGFGYDMATSIGGARIKQANAVGAGLQQIASHSLLGTLGKDQSRTMARGLLDMADSSYGIQTGLDRTEIQDNLLGFASSGGYENVRTAEEFEKVSKDVIMNTRKVMTTLRTTQAEALKLMADLQREGLVDAGDMGNFSANMSGLSQVTGMDSGRVLNFVRQGAEMFRGSSLGMGGGMNIMEQALQDTRDMMKSSDVSRGIIRELGGVDAATIGRTESNVNFMNSTLGLMSYNNWQAGGATGNRRDIVDNLGGRDIFDVYKLQVQRDRDIASGDYSQQRISRDRIMTDGNLKGYVDAWERTNEGSFFEDPTNLASWMRYSVATGTFDTVAEAGDALLQSWDPNLNPAQQKARKARATLRALNKSQQVSQWDQMWSGVGKNIKNFGLETLGFERLGQETIEFEETVTDAMSGLFLGYNTVQTGQSTGNAVNELMAMSPEEMATVKAEVEALTTPTGVLTRNKDTKQLLNEGSWLASSGNVDGGTRNWTGKMKQNYGMIYAGVLGKTGGNAEDIMGLTVLDEIMGNRHDVQIAGGFEALAKDFNIIMGSGKGEITDSEVAKLEQELNAGVGKNLTVLDSVSGAQMYKTILGEAMSVSTGGKIKSFETGSDVEKQKAMALVLESDKFGEIVKNTRKEVFGPSKGILLDEFTPTLVLNRDEAAAKLASLNGITRNKDTKQLLNEGSWLASSGNVDGGTRNWTGKMKQNYGMIYAGVLGKTGGNAEDIMGLTVLDEIMGNRHDVQIAGGFEALAKDFNIIMGSGKGEITDSEVAKLEQELNAGVGKNLTVLDSVSGAQMYKTILGEAMSVSTGGKIKSFETGSDVEKQKAMALVLESDKFGEIVKNTREEVFGPSKGILLDEFTPTLVLNPDEAAAKFAETELYKKVQGLDVDFSTDLAKGWDDALDTFESLKTKITNVTGTEYAEHINDNLKDFTTFAAMHGTELKTVVKSELKKDNLSRGKRQNLQKILIGIDAVGQTSDEDGNLIADLDSRNDRHKAYAKAVAAGAINPKTGEILDAKQLFSINEVGFKQIATGGADAATVKLFMDTKEAFQIEAAQGDEQAREQLASMEAISGKMSYGGIKAAIIAGTVSGAHASLEVTEGDLKVADKIVATNRLLQTIVDDGLKTK